jgi:hypothetical protein
VAWLEFARINIAVFKITAEDQKSHVGCGALAEPASFS